MNIQACFLNHSDEDGTPPCSPYCQCVRILRQSHHCKKIVDINWFPLFQVRLYEAYESVTAFVIYEAPLTQTGKFSLTATLQLARYIRCISPNALSHIIWIQVNRNRSISTRLKIQIDLRNSKVLSFRWVLLIIYRSDTYHWRVVVFITVKHKPNKLSLTTLLLDIGPIDKIIYLKGNISALQKYLLPNGTGKKRHKLNWKMEASMRWEVIRLFKSIVSGKGGGDWDERRQQLAAGIIKNADRRNSGVLGIQNDADEMILRDSLYHLK